MYVSSDNVGLRRPVYYWTAFPMMIVWLFLWQRMHAIKTVAYSTTSSTERERSPRGFGGLDHHWRSCTVLLSSCASMLGNRGVSGERVWPVVVHGSPESTRSSDADWLTPRALSRGEQCVQTGSSSRKEATFPFVMLERPFETWSASRATFGKLLVAKVGVTLDELGGTLCKGAVCHLSDTAMLLSDSK